MSKVLKVGKKVKKISKKQKQLEKSKKSYEKLIAEHQKKYDDFMKDPIGNSSDEAIKQMSKDNPSKKVLLERARGRGGALQKQLNKQKGELEKVNQKLDDLSKGETTGGNSNGSIIIVTSASADGTSENGTEEGTDNDAKVKKIASKMKDLNPLSYKVEGLSNAGKLVFGQGAGTFIDDWLNPFGMANDMLDSVYEKAAKDMVEKAENSKQCEEENNCNE